MAKKGSIVTYQHIILGGQIGSSYTPESGPNYELDLAKTTFNWTIANQNVVTNESKVDWTLTVENLKNYSMDSIYIDEFYIYDKTSSIAKTLYYNGDSVNVTNGAVAYSGSFTFTHDDDGAFSLPISIRAYMSADSSAGNYYYSNYALEGATTISLEKISRHAMIYEAPNFTDEDSPVINYAMPSGTTAEVYISLDGKATTQSIPARTVTGSGNFAFVFTEDELKTLWAIQDQGLLQKQVLFVIKSEFRGEVFYETLSRMLSIINYKPTLDPEVYDTVDDIVNRLTGNKYILVRYASKPYFKTGASGHKGGYIDTQSVKNGATTIYGAEGTFDSVTDNIFTFAAVDNYGRAVTADMEFSRPNGYFIDYVKLTCNVSVSEMTADGDVEVTLTGKYFDGTFGKRDNSMRMHYDIIKNNGDPEHVDMGYINPSVFDSDYSYKFTISGLDYMGVYQLTVRVSDEIAVQGAEARTILASTPLFDWGREDFAFNIPVSIQGWTVDTVVEESTGEIGFYEDASGLPQYGGYEWTFRKWSSGLMECWCSLPITTNVSSAWGGLYTSGRLIQTNLLFPREFAEPPVVTATLAAGYAGGILMTTGSSSKPVTKYSAGTLEIARGTSYSNASYTINYNVKGRWK